MKFSFFAVPDPAVARSVRLDGEHFLGRRCVGRAADAAAKIHRRPDFGETQ